MQEHYVESSINISKPTFELNIGMGSKGHRLFIVASQSYSEETLVSELTRILNHADTVLDNETGHLRSRSCSRQCFQSGLKWILGKPDKNGIYHRIGLCVPPK